MKKLFFAIVMILAASNLMAQVKFESGSLNDAVAKAKAEGKMVMLIGSASWCGPCKFVAKEILPTKEAGDFLNAKFLTLKYELDVADPDNVSKRFGVRAYPTFIFLDGEGNEVARMLGGARDTKGFLDRIAEATDPKNSNAAKAERFKNDPSYAMEYITGLKKNYMDKEADEALAALFAKRTIQENFDEKSVAFYNDFISDTNSPIIQYMLKNSKEVKAVMGDTKFNEFIASKANNKIASMVFARKFNKESYDKVMAEVKTEPMFQTPYYSFMATAGDAYFAKDFKTVVAAATKSVKKADSQSRMMIVTTVRNAASEGRTLKEENKAAFLKFLELCSKSESDAKMKTNYDSMIKAIKDPESMKKDGAIPAMRMM